MRPFFKLLTPHHDELRYLLSTPVEDTTPCRWFVLEAQRGDLRETHGIRDMFHSPQTVSEVVKGVEKGVREWRSADRPILALRRRQPALTDRGERVCEPTVPCTKSSKNHPDGNHNRQQ